MANTFHQIYIHIIFSVKARQHLLPKSKKTELHRYIAAVINNNNCKPILINSMPDHIHIFVGLHPSVSISTLVKDIKLATNQLINKRKWIRGKFAWQKGFGVFSYSHSHIDRVYKYIENQEKHHTKQSFQKEYISFLKKFKIEYDSNYVFDIEEE